MKRTTGHAMTQASLPSERSFGFLFACVFAVAGFYGFYKGWQFQAVGMLFVVGLVSGGLALVAPQWLAPLNRSWFRLGQVLGKIVSPIMLGIIFFGLLTPIALIARALGRDELKLKPQDVTSYWIERKPPEPTESFKNQF